MADWISGGYHRLPHHDGRRHCRYGWIHGHYYAQKKCGRYPGK